MKAINTGGLAGRQYKEVDSLFFKFQGFVPGPPLNMLSLAHFLVQIRVSHGGCLEECPARDEEAWRSEL